MQMRRSLALSLVASLSPLLTGCLASSDGGKVAVAPYIPPIPSKLREPCADPGVSAIASTDDAVEVIGANRSYAACYKRKWNGVVGLYQNVQTKVGGSR